MVWRQPALREKFYAKIVGRDSIRLWIENPKLETTRVRDDNGVIIPPDRRQLEEHGACTDSLGHHPLSRLFPTRQGFDTAEDEEASALGRGMYL